jgi:hypothetical protein
MLKFSKPDFIMRQSHVRVPRNVRQTSHKNDLRELARKTVGGEVPSGRLTSPSVRSTKSGRPTGKRTERMLRQQARDGVK